MPSTTHPEWLVRLAARGFKLVFYPAKQKGPEEKGWTTKVYTLDDYREGMNVGCILGHEVAEGKFLVDFDFDWTEGVALARDILPPTGFGFGRASRKISHAFYTTSEPMVSRRYENIDGKPLFELRGTKTDGTLGLQTMLPPSIHPSEEQVELRVDEDITHMDIEQMGRLADLLAISQLLFFHLGKRALIHEIRLGLAGFLFNMGCTEEEVLLVGETLAKYTGNDVADMRLAVRSTAVRHKSGEKVAGSATLMKAFGEDGKAIITRIREWLGQKDFIRTKNDVIAKDSQFNIRMALEKLGATFSWDEFRYRPMITYEGRTEILEDRHVKMLLFKIESTFGWRPNKDVYNDLVKVIAWEQPFHPVKDYLGGLKWDGVARIDTWLTTYGGAADQEYTRAVSRMVLIAAVRRVYEPGAKFDELLVLEGEQGANKSSALAALCPEEDWFTDDLPLDVDSKEVMERTAGKWIIEAAELSGMRASQREHLKAMLSRQADGPARMAYAEHPTTRKRQFILIGTTNDHYYLNDPTGNRRFWPVRTEQFDVEGIRRDRDQLWAEAVVRERKGESIRLPPELYHVAGVQQERRREIDPWEVQLREAFEEYDMKVPYNEVWNLLGVDVERRTQQMSSRLSKIMQSLEFKPNQAMWDPNISKTVKGWSRGNPGAPSRASKLPGMESEE